MSRIILVAAAAFALMIALPGGALAAPPANDDFANAAAISALPFSDAVDTTEATDAGFGEAQPCYRPSHTIWYAYTPSENSVLRADASGGSYDTTLTIYQGSGLGLVGCTAFGGSLSLTAQAGVTYYFQLGSYYGSGGLTKLNVVLVPPPSNDDFADAKPISSLPFADSVDTTAATVESGEPTPSCSFTPVGGSAWYAYTPSITGSISASITNVPGQVAAYTGSGLNNLTQVGCRGFSPLTFRAEAGQTYYLQVGGLFGNRVLQLNVDIAPKPVVSLGMSLSDPSSFDTVQFYDSSYDPGGLGIESRTWDFGDGGSSTDQYPTHRFASDGDYTVELTVTTPDGRSASTSRLVQVRTHDVAIVRFAVPQSASANQTKTLTLGIENARYPETVQVQLLKSVPGGSFQQVGILTQSVPIRNGGRTTDFKFSYTFTDDDAAVGKVTFQAIATIVGARDAVQGDNTAIALPTGVKH